MTIALAEVRGSRPRLDQDVYFSIDIETDGPIPGDFSMLSFAIVEAGHHDGERYVASERSAEAYWELKPISDNVEMAALAVNKLDRARLLDEASDPRVAMEGAAKWIRERSGGRRAIMVASPAGFDWMFLHWYFVKYVGESPFGYSGAFDIKTAIAVKFDRPVALSGRGNLPRWLESSLPHTHNALDDAREQAKIFGSLLASRFRAGVA